MTEQPPAPEQRPKSWLEEDFRELSLMLEKYDAGGEMTLEEVAGKVNHIYRCDWPWTAGRRPPEIATEAELNALKAREDIAKAAATIHVGSDRRAMVDGKLDDVLYNTVKRAIDRLADVVSEERRIG